MARFKPFIVFGPSKSGTTWLQKLLDTHPKVSCKFQIPIFPILDSRSLLFPVSKSRKSIFAPSKGIYHSGKSPFEGIFNGIKSEEIYRHRLSYVKNISDSFWSYYTKLGADDDLLRIERDKVRRGFINLMQAFLEDGNPAKTIYGTKAYTDLERFFEIYPDSKVIVIFRDGRDVAASKRFHHKRQGFYTAGDEKSYLLRLIHSTDLGRKFSKKILVNKLGVVNADSFLIDEHSLFSRYALEKIVQDWKLVSEYLLEWSDYKSKQIITIRYENLQFRPLQELKKVFEFLGVETEISLIQQIIEQNDIKTLKKSNDSFFRSGRTGSWRSYFTTSDRKIFKDIAGGTLIKLGYVNSLDW